MTTTRRVERRKTPLTTALRRLLAPLVVVVLLQSGLCSGQAVADPPASTPVFGEPTSPGETPPQWAPTISPQDDEASLTDACKRGNWLSDRLHGVNIFWQAKCASANLVAGWWDKLGEVTMGSTQFRPDDPGVRQLYASMEMLAISIMVGFLLWNVGITRARGGSALAAAPRSFVSFGMAVLISIFLPAVAYYAEAYFIDPITTALIGQQSNSVHAFSVRFLDILMDDGLIGGVLTAIIYGIVTGLGALVLFGLMAVRALGLTVLMMFGPIFLAGMVNGDRWDSLRAPVKYAGALFLMKPVIALLILLGMKMAAVQQTGSFGQNLSTLIVGLAIIFASIFSFVGIARVIGVGGNHLAQAGALRQELRGAGTRMPGFVPSPTTLAHNRIAQSLNGGGSKAAPNAGTARTSRTTNTTTSASRAAGNAGTAGTAAGAAAGPAGAATVAAARAAGAAAKAPQRAGGATGRTMDSGLPQPPAGRSGPGAGRGSTGPGSAAPPRTPPPQPPTRRPNDPR